MSESMSKSARGDDVVLLPTSHYMFAMVDFAVAGGPEVTHEAARLLKDAALVQQRMERLSLPAPCGGCGVERGRCVYCYEALSNVSEIALYKHNNVATDHLSGASFEYGAHANCMRENCGVFAHPDPVYVHDECAECGRSKLSQEQSPQMKQALSSYSEADDKCNVCVEPLPSCLCKLMVVN